MSLVSIVVPSYNQGAFIGRTLDSLLEQDYGEIEIWVIDGGSTDGTLEVLDGYDDPRMQWISEPDEGQADAINKGLRRAEGDLLTYLNSDDVLLPGALRFIAEAFAADPDVTAIYGDGYFIDEDDKPIEAIDSAPFVLREALHGDHHVLQQGCVWRRSVTETIGLFDASLDYVMDVDYWIRMGLHGLPPTYMPGKRAGFRLHTASKTVSQPYGFYKDFQAIMRKIYSDPTLRADVVQWEEEVFSYHRKREAEWFWRNKDFEQARPILRAMLTQGPVRHRVLAVTMLVDSYLHTPFTQALQGVWQMGK